MSHSGEQVRRTEGRRAQRVGRRKSWDALGKRTEPETAARVALRLRRLAEPALSRQHGAGQPAVPWCLPEGCARTAHCSSGSAPGGPRGVRTSVPAGLAR